MSALGHLFFEGNESTSYLEARRESLVLSVVEPDEDAQKVVDFIAALILITYIEYGANNEEQASLCLTRASRLAIRYGLNLLDIDEKACGQDESLLVQICQRDTRIVEIARRVWWEVSRLASRKGGVPIPYTFNLQLFLADVVVHIATSGSVSRNLDSLVVNVVCAPCLPGTNDQEPYQMRIRAALLAAEIMERKDTHLTSMDSILATLIFSVQERWLVFSKRSSQSSDMTSESSSIAAIGQGLLFQTLLMLHA